MAVVLLDAGLVGLAICDAEGKDGARNAEVEAFQSWLESRSAVVHDFAIVDVTRFEVLRGLRHRPNRGKSRRLAELFAATTSVAVDLPAWERAAEMWGDLRRQGWSTADARALDGDMLLAAVAEHLATSGEAVIVATTNVKHLAWTGVDARLWRDIPDRE